jgi:hypothetical protein
LSFSIVPGGSYVIANNIPLERNPIFRRGEIVDIYSIQRETPEYPGFIYVVKSSFDGHFYSLHQNHFSAPFTDQEVEKASGEGSKITKRRRGDWTIVCGASGLTICLFALLFFYYASKITNLSQTGNAISREFGMLLSIAVAILSGIIGVVAIAISPSKKDGQSSPYGMLLGLATVLLSITVFILASHSFSGSAPEPTPTPMHAVTPESVQIEIQAEPAVVAMGSTVRMRLTVNNTGKESLTYYTFNDWNHAEFSAFSKDGSEVWSDQSSHPKNGSTSAILHTGITEIEEKWNTGSTPPGIYKIQGRFAGLSEKSIRSA